ncbi:MAG: hypothetical protein IJ860_07795 [Eubacterium sp.]|nr:hypothetical protein [Eubacterium sp.]
MARARDPAAPMIEALFGTEMQPVRLTVLANKTGIPRRSLENYRKDPWSIPAGRMRKLIKARQLTDEQITKMWR